MKVSDLLSLRGMRVRHVNEDANSSSFGASYILKFYSKKLSTLKLIYGSIMTVYVHVIIQLNVSRRNHFTGVMKTRPRCLNHFNLLFLYPSGYASWSIDYP